MGKRSNFERKPRDFYPTPKEAVEPLLDFLSIKRNPNFIEPCAGDGQLMDILTGAGYKCKLALDIEPQRDDIVKADALQYDLSSLRSAPEYNTHIITNPPWDRKILHPMIEHFRRTHHTWLLFDADWMHTKQAIPYMEHCATVLSIGRVKWIPGSKSNGKDNCCWYLFVPGWSGHTTFYTRKNKNRLVMSG